MALNAPRIPTAIANDGLRWQDLSDPQSPVLVNDDHLAAGVVTLPVKPVAILEHADGLHTLHYIVTLAIGGICVWGVGLLVLVTLLV